ncbi:hypothetical protein LCGC14_0775020 [marine sediment metagenome]|uniref:Uncharacterized protein n=1 Tax=marine sediment metagenome TaxID=412755 RepID=A0A0F9Q1F3_9ZZZZ
MMKENLDKETVRQGFNTISSMIFTILEYNEIDLTWFLMLKKRIWYYQPLLYIKSVLIISCILWMVSANSFLILFKVQLLIAYEVGFISYFIIDYISFRNFRYSLWFYRKRKNFLNRLNTQMNLMINNHILSTVINQEVQEFKKKQPQLNKRISHFSTSIKSYRTHLEKIGIIIAIFIPFISFMLDLFIEFYKNVGPLDPTIINELLINLIPVLGNLIIFGIIAININHRRFKSEKELIIATEILVESVLVALVLMVKLVEFPDEKKAMELLKKDISHWKDGIPEKSEKVDSSNNKCHIF